MLLVAINKSIERFSLLNRAFSFLRISSRMPLSIQALGWLKYSHGSVALSEIPLKHLGLADFPIMMGFSLSPLPFTKKAQVSLPFDLFPPVQLRDASARDLFGKALKNCPVSSILQMFFGAYPCKISGSLSFQASTVSSRTSPAYPEMNLALIPFLCLK